MGTYIVITPEEEITIKEYKEFDEFSTAISNDENNRATIARYLGFDNPFNSSKEKNFFGMYGDDNGLIQPTAYDNKVNALASVMMADVHLSQGGDGSVYPLYGNIVLIKEVMGEDGLECAGLDKKEEMALCQYLNIMKSKEQNLINSVHEHYDDNKPEPYMNVMSFDNAEDFEKEFFGKD